MRRVVALVLAVAFSGCAVKDWSPEQQTAAATATATVVGGAIKILLGGKGTPTAAPTPVPAPRPTPMQPACNDSIGWSCDCYRWTDTGDVWDACPLTEPTPAATVAPPPPPVPTPDSCPCFQRIGIARHGEPFPERADPMDHSKGWVICHRYDSTGRFGRTPRGVPCNGEHHDICSKAHAEPTPYATLGPNGEKAPQCHSYRRCEFAPRWDSHGGRKRRPAGFQYVICGLKGESYTVTAGPPVEPADELGVPLVFCPGAGLRESMAGTF